MGRGCGEEDRGGVVGKHGAAEELAEQLEARSVGKVQGTILRTKWIATGFVDEHLGAALDRLAGVGAGTYEDSDELIDQLVAAARVGDAAKGEKHFKAATMACASCHKVGDVGGGLVPIYRLSAAAFRRSAS